MRKKEPESDDIVMDADIVGTEDVFEDADVREETKLIKVKKELAACRAEKQEYLDGWQRAKADYVNSLKRFEAEKTQLKSRSVAGVVGAFLPILDSLDRAKASEELPSGFAAIAKQIESAFAAFNVVPVQAKVGDPFDPELHEALGQDETDDIALDDTISVVLEKGWQVGDIIVRPVRVRVARCSTT